MTAVVPAVCSGPVAPLSWRGVVGIAALAVLVAAQMFVTIPLVGPISSDLGVVRGAAAGLTAAFAVGYALASLISGPLADAWGRHRLVRAAVLTTGLLQLAAVATDSFATLVAVRALQGLAAGAVMPMAYVEVSTRSQPRRLLGHLTLVSGAMASSVLLGQLASAAIAAQAGWRAVFAVGGVALVAASPLAARMFSEAASGSHLTGGPHADTGRRGPGILALVPFVMPTLLVAGTITATFTALETQGVDSRTLTWLRAASLPALAIAVLSHHLVPVRSLGRRAGVAVVLGVSGALCLSQSETVWPGVLLVVAGLAGLGPSIIAATARRTRVSRNRLLAAYGFVLNLGGAAGAALGGAMASMEALSTVMVTAFMLGGLGLWRGFALPTTTDDETTRSPCPNWVRRPRIRRGGCGRRQWPGA